MKETLAKEHTELVSSYNSLGLLFVRNGAVQHALIKTMVNYRNSEPVTTTIVDIAFFRHLLKLFQWTLHIRPLLLFSPGQISRL